VITFIALGKYLEARSKVKTGDAIEKLLNLQAKTALVIRDGREQDIPVSEVIHDDLAKQSEWESLGPAQGPVRQMAYDYLTMLLTQAAFLCRMIRLGLAMAIDLPASPLGLGRDDEPA